MIGPIEEVEKCVMGFKSGYGSSGKDALGRAFVRSWIAVLNNEPLKQFFENRLRKGKDDIGFKKRHVHLVLVFFECNFVDIFFLAFLLVGHFIDNYIIMANA